MDRPPLSLALASVLTARVQGDRRRLLSSMRRPVEPVDDAAPLAPARLTLVPRPLATVIPLLPRLIPGPRRPAAERHPQPDPQPDPAA